MASRGLLPSEGAVLILLSGFLHSGAITLRWLEGWRDLPATPVVQPQPQRQSKPQTSTAPSGLISGPTEDDASIFSST